ncbi:PTS sugar transporter subunit IIA [Niallia endozanthoxylica]|uniref:PTS glucose transporter subunit IIA n=1 Tax=Niallia endozanthoxylica TaxID=2036016 RepID=A0A5J5I3Q0_9BACI|nr:PTS glucose transporter subunit IIA [Niallia endozanthoxylica]KAA9029946.1 PTS glucose transporter subunit IIA [Niallia endozanthoxylica]
MFKSLFKKNKEPEQVQAPLTGKIVALEEVPDPVFSQKMMGDGIAIIPADKKVYSPVDGEVVNVFPTKHAISLRSKMGVELLIHMGLETVELKGEGFQILVQDGTKVSKGEPIAEFDFEKVSSLGKEVITPVILLNGDQFKIENKQTGASTTGGKDIIMEIAKA